MFVELTLADGRKTAIPKEGVRLVEAFTPGSFEKHPEAAAFLLFQTEGAMAHAFVRDSFVQVMRLFPLAAGGAKWLDFKRADGSELAVADGTIVGWTQKEADDNTLFHIRVRARQEEIDTYEVVSTFETIRSLTNTEIEEPPKKKKGQTAPKIDDL